MNVSIQNVTKRFGAVAAAEDVSFDIQDGELFFLLGPSGCGKTTVLRLIAGFYAPDAGEIRFDGRPVNDVPPNQRNTGMVFQNYALWPHMTVAENVAYGLDVRGASRDEKERRVRDAQEVLGAPARRGPVLVGLERLAPAREVGQEVLRRGHSVPAALRRCSKRKRRRERNRPQPSSRKSAGCDEPRISNGSGGDEKLRVFFRRGYGS